MVLTLHGLVFYMLVLLIEKLPVSNLFNVKRPLAIHKELSSFPASGATEVVLFR